MLRTQLFCRRVTPICQRHGGDRSSRRYFARIPIHNTSNPDFFSTCRWYGLGAITTVSAVRELSDDVQGSLMYFLLHLTFPQVAAEAGLETDSRIITAHELRKHRSKQSCWVAVDGVVWE